MRRKGNVGGRVAEGGRVWIGRKEREGRVICMQGSRGRKGAGLGAISEEEGKCWRQGSRGRKGGGLEEKSEKERQDRAVKSKEEGIYGGR